jgi:hypothetical protein
MVTMNNLILATSQPEGFIYKYSAFPNIFNTVTIIILSAILILGIATTLILKENEYLLYTALALLFALAIIAMTAYKQNSDADEKANLTALTSWAQERYHLDLTEEQIKNLRASNWEEKPNDYKPVIVNGNKLVLSKPDELEAVFIIVSEYKAPDDEYKPEDNNKKGESW